MLLQKVIIMKSEIKILKLLLDKKDEKFTIRKISEAAGLNYRIAYEKVMLLEKEGLMRITKAGNSKICELTYRFDVKIFEAEQARRDELLKNKNLSVMLDSFMGISSKLFVLLVFGSYAKKTNTKFSDIDLMFIVPDEAEKNLDKEIQTIAFTLPLKIHISVFKESEFRAMKNSKEATVGSEAIKNNIVLYGVEPYYGMIQ